MELRDHLVVALMALGISALLALPVFDLLRGLSIDWLTGLRWRFVGQQHSLAQSPAVVVAIDEETYRHPPFAGTPNVTWTGEIGRVIDAMVDAGAEVVALDIVFPTSMEESQIPFDGATLGSKLRGFDREYLRAIAKAARAGRLVLGQVQHQERPIVPSAGQRIAAGHDANLRLLNVYTDADEVVRRIPFAFDVNGARVPSLPVELAARLLGKPAQLDTRTGLTLDGWRVPEGIPGTFAVNFAGGGDEIPTYSLADLHACLQKGDHAYFREQFSGRAVLIGAVLDLEDRKVTSKRLATGREGAFAKRCVLPAAQPARFERESIAGVYVHAAAVNNLVRRNPLSELTRATGWGISALLSLAAAAAVWFLPLGTAMAALGACAVAWIALSVSVFARALVLPLADAGLAVALTVVTVIGYRFIVADKDKRLLRRSFSMYLAPALVDRVVTAKTPPRLGGEIRVVTLFRTDLAGYSALSERSEPDALVALMNEYLSAMTDIIGEHGGFVDKYIGDAIDGVFGVPVDDPDHGFHAVAAALACDAKLAELNAAGLPAFRGMTLRHRIGIHTGPGLVGNIGSRRRFNYTVVGDSANLASRIEGANKAYGTSIMVSEDTAAAAGDRILWRELDRIRVVGRAAPLTVLEPLALAAGATPAQRALAARYAEGLALFRRRQFAEAAAVFARTAAADPPSAAFEARARRLATEPPNAAWEPVHNLDRK